MMSSQSVPILLDRRSIGLLRPSTFSHRILAFHSTWSISENHRIVSVTNRNDSHTTALDLSSTSEYLLTGNTHGACGIYHLSEPKVSRHTLLQQAQCPSRGPAQVTALQWYPVDTGVFVTATSSGSVCIWDTNAMTPVLEAQPFAYRTSNNEPVRLRCMDLAPSQPLAAVGSSTSSSIQLVDLQSGAASHSLTPSENGGIFGVQWSPVHPHLLASCGPTATLLWDIRRPNRILTQCNAADRPRDPLVASSYSWDGSHFRKPSKGGGGATSVSFDATGQRLVTIDGVQRDISVWDLRHDRPLRQQGNYVDKNNGKPVDKDGGNQPLVVLDDSLYCVRHNELVQYPLANDKNGQSTHVLRGHLGHIHATTATKSMIVTAASDALILVWERHHRQKGGLRNRDEEVEDRDNW